MRNLGEPSLQFDNSFLRELPADAETENYPRQVRAAYSRVLPQQVPQPRLVAYSREVAEELQLDPAWCETEDFVQVFSGNRLLPGMEPFAMCYGGHQFGNWAGQLGDGRAINLGEVVHGGKRLALQLKGAGSTPYSRGADGLAVLRSSIREFLCSEAMHHLGVPTTRALSVVETGQQVMRDMFYDGNPRLEPGAVVCRVAPSFIRFGHFEILAARRDVSGLRRLLDYCLKFYAPHLGEPGAATYLEWFRELCRSTADMIVHWMRVGFVHGVMNTDNMSIHGITIDYGPYGWIDDYDPDWTPNTTDAHGRRYRFANQPSIAQWNLLQLANAIYPLIEDADALREAVEHFGKYYESSWQDMMRAKLGLREFRSSDGGLLRNLDAVLRRVKTDMTIFFRLLAELDCSKESLARSDQELLAPLLEAYYEPEAMSAEDRKAISVWLRAYIQRVVEEDAGPGRRERMNSVNPKFVLRNYIAQEAIDLAEQGDYSRVRELLDLLRRPYDEQPERQQYFAKRPAWAENRPGCSMLSCSS